MIENDVERIEKKIDLFFKVLLGLKVKHIGHLYNRKYIENLPDWNVVFVNGKEGFCDKDKKEIHIGKKAEGSYFKWLFLHEITHALIDNHHYSDEFREKMNELCKKYEVKYKNSFYD